MNNNYDMIKSFLIQEIKRLQTLKSKCDELNNFIFDEDGENIDKYDELKKYIFKLNHKLFDKISQKLEANYKINDIIIEDRCNIKFNLTFEGGVEEFAITFEGDGFILRQKRLEDEKDT
jgi:hypothetical protein